MSLRYCLIVNPAAGKGRGRKLLPAALNLLATAGAEVQARESASLADAAAIARKAAAEGATVVAVGGDGMVGALAGALTSALTGPVGTGATGTGATGTGATGTNESIGAARGATPQPGAQRGGVLGIIPAGRGNDFARMLGIPADPADAARILLAGGRRAVDLIGVRSGDGPELAVAGSVYLGIPSEGGEIANRSRWVTGPLGYQIAGLRAVMRWRAATFTVQAHHGWGPGDPGPAPLDDRSRPGAVISGPGGTLGIGVANSGPSPVDRPSRSAGRARAGAGTVESFPGFCVVVANSVYLAAGLRAAPDADVSDGLLDVLTVRHSKEAAADGSLPLRSKLPFIRVMREAGSGAHIRLPDVRTSQASVVSVTVDRDMLAAADGETLPFAAPLPAGSALLIRSLPGALRVIAPPPGG